MDVEGSRIMDPRFFSACFSAYSCLLLCLASSPLIRAEFLHPGIAHSQERLDFVRTQISKQESPLQSAWIELESSNYSSLDWKAEPRPHIERGPYNNPNIGSSEFTNDGRAAYTHALHWNLSGEEERAKIAADILDAWSATLETVSNHDARLLVGMSGFPYIVAAELLTHTWDGWPQKNQDRFKKMLREIWYPIIKDFYPTANGNWDASMMQTIIAMGVYLDDQQMFDRVVHYTLEGEGNGAIDNYFIESGQCQESGRDQAHTQMGLEFLVNTCETAWIQGVDLYGAHNNRLLKGFEYTAKYNLGNKVPYQPYKSFQGRYYYTELSDNARGRLRPMYEKAFNHYHNRKGLAAPYSKEAIVKRKADALKRKNNSKRRRRKTERVSSLPWSALMYSGSSES